MVVGGGQSYRASVRTETRGRSLPSVSRKRSGFGMAAERGASAMSVIVNIWKLLNRRQRRQLLLLQATALVLGVSTLLGIVSAVPFFAVLGDPSLAHRIASLSRLYDYLGFHDERSFLTALGISFLCIVLLSNTINLIGSVAMNRFAHRIGNELAVALFDDYMHRDYLFHVVSNSATLLNNVVWEASRGITG